GHQWRRADQQFDAATEARAQQLVGDDRHLDRRDRAEVVEQRSVAPAWIGQRGQQSRGQQLDDRAPRPERARLDAWFTVDAEPELALVCGEALGWELAGDRAALQADAERANVGRDGPRLIGDVAERVALLGEVAGDLVHEQGARDPARLRGVGQRDVVGDEHGLDALALRPRTLGREPEVEAIAGVVLDDQQ